MLLCETHICVSLYIYSVNAKCSLKSCLKRRVAGYLEGLDCHYLTSWWFLLLSSFTRPDFLSLFYPEQTTRQPLLDTNKNGYEGKGLCVFMGLKSPRSSGSIVFFVFGIGLLKIKSNTHNKHFTFKYVSGLKMYFKLIKLFPPKCIHLRPS